MKHTIGFQLDGGFLTDLANRLEKERLILNKFSEGVSNRLRDIVGEFCPPESIPTSSHLSTLIDVAFWTSLQKDESRPLVFTVDYYGRGTKAVSGVTLDRHLKFCSKELAKLAPASSRQKWAIAVAVDDNNLLQIIGLASGDPIGISRSKFQIKTIDPGTLLVGLFRSNVAVVSPSITSLLESPLLKYHGATWQLIKPEEDDERGIKFHIKIDLVLSLLRQMYYLGHGGILIIVPDGEAWRNSVETPITYATSPTIYNAFTLKLISNAYKKNDTAYASRLETQLDESARRIANLSTLDGAVIIDKSLELIGFGAKLLSAPNPDKPTTIGVVTPFGDMKKYEYVSLEQLGNMRHQSAARFIYNQPEALAFVVSQDRGITAMMGQILKDGSVALVVHKQLELTLF